MPKTKKNSQAKFILLSFLFAFIMTGIVHTIINSEATDAEKVLIIMLSLFTQWHFMTVMLKNKN